MWQQPSFTKKGGHMIFNMHTDLRLSACCSVVHETGTHLAILTQTMLEKTFIPPQPEENPMAISAFSPTGSFSTLSCVCVAFFNMQPQLSTDQKCSDYSAIILHYLCVSIQPLQPWAFSQEKVVIRSSTCAIILECIVLRRKKKLGEVTWPKHQSRQVGLRVFLVCFFLIFCQCPSCPTLPLSFFFCQGIKVQSWVEKTGSVG